jgi:DNA-binding MarR family transcriptional regulator
MYSRSSDPKNTPRGRGQAKTGTGRSVEEARRRRRLAVAIGESLRELAIQLSLLNHQVGAQLDLRDVDLDCLDLIDRHGPLSPSALARWGGLHPATITGILDRLEGGGWVVRERDPSDRRAVVVRTVRERVPDLLRLYAGMNRSMNEIYAGYDEGELELIADFLDRTANAGRSATAELSGN